MFKFEDGIIYFDFDPTWVEAPVEKGIITTNNPFGLVSGILNRKLLLTNRSFDYMKYKDLSDFICMNVTLSHCRMIRECPYSMVLMGDITPDFSNIKGSVYGLSVGRYGITKNMKNTITDHHYTVTFISKIWHMFKQKKDMKKRSNRKGSFYIG